MSEQNRLKQSDRTKIIAEFLKGNLTEGYKVIETKDKNGNDRYIVRRIKSKDDVEAIEAKIAKLKKQLEDISKPKDDVPVEQQSK